MCVLVVRVKGASVEEAGGGVWRERQCFTERWMGWIEGAAGVDWQAG